MMSIFFLAILCLVLASCAVLNHPRFGKAPEGERLERVQASPNYHDGEFENQIPTRTLAEGQSTFKIIVGSWFSSPERLRPTEPLPTVRVYLLGPNAIDRDQDLIIWLGHSSYFIQLDGKRFLMDPVFSDHAAPFSIFNKAFAGTNLYSADDMPQIDYLLITHDHWDHLDYPTVKALENKVGAVICPLGVGQDFEYWGYPKDKIHSGDWGAAFNLENGLAIHVVPSRHFSGRLLTRNKTLWAGFVIETPNQQLFFSGDTGYGPHFADLAETFGGFDFVAVDGGQYDPRWPLIHMTPEEAVQAAEDLKAKSMLLAHVGRFCISSHPWDEPFKRAVEAAKGKDFRLLTPRIGEPVRLDMPGQQFSHWWEGID